MSTTIKPILKYPGAKWQIADWIISYFPPHVHYVEPFAGSLAVFFNKAPAKHEVINDLSGDICNLFRVIREHGDELAALLEMTPWAREEYELSYEPCCDVMERARRFIVRVGQGHGSSKILTSLSNTWSLCTLDSDRTRTPVWNRIPEQVLSMARRLKDVEIDNTGAVQFIERYPGRDVLIYADPPYPLSTRAGKMYQHEMTDADHIELLDTLDAHPGPVVLSGYACPLYDDRLVGWHRVTKQVQAEKGNTRTEVLWLNDKAQPAQGRLF